MLSVSALPAVDVVANVEWCATCLQAWERQFYQLPNQLPVSAMLIKFNFPPWIMSAGNGQKWRTGLKSNKDSRMSSRVPEDSPGSSRRSIHSVRLLRLIARNNTSKNYNATERKFSVRCDAHCLYEGAYVFQSGVCPDLPENLDGLVVVSCGLSVSVITLTLATSKNAFGLRTASTRWPTFAVWRTFLTQKSNWGHTCVLHCNLALLILTHLPLLLSTYPNRITGTPWQSKQLPWNCKIQWSLMSRWKFGDHCFSLASGKVDPFDVLHQLSENLPMGQDSSSIAHRFEMVQSWRKFFCFNRSVFCWRLSQLHSLNLFHATL